MADKYVSKTDLEYYHGRIKTVFATQTALEGKVDKVSGKGLSTNDYTTAEKNKLAGISAGAQVNVIESVKRNGTALTVTNKTVDISVPTKVSDLTNDSGYITTAAVPQASASTPLMDGTASTGSETAWARGDHKHPTDTSRAASNHVHGNINNNGTITATAVAPANNDALVMTDASASGKLVKSTIAFDGSTTNQFLTKQGAFNQVYADIVSFQSQDTLFEDTDTVAEALDVLANAKVDAVSGKGLSTNDYTTAEKNKLAGIAEGATVDDKTWNGVVLSNASTTDTNAATYIPWLVNYNSTSAFLGKADSTPTANAVAKFDKNKRLSSTTPADGDSSTLVATTAFVGTAITNALSGITGIDYQVVTTLPTTGTKGVIYLVSHSHGTQDAYDEYIWTGSAYEQIGSTDIDLSGYWAKTELTAMTTAEIDALFE